MSTIEPLGVPSVVLLVADLREPRSPILQDLKCSDHSEKAGSLKHARAYCTVDSKAI